LVAAFRRRGADYRYTNETAYLAARGGCYQSLAGVRGQRLEWRALDRGWATNVAPSVVSQESPTAGHGVTTNNIFTRRQLARVMTNPVATDTLCGASGQRPGRLWRLVQP
jgi:hypothetical protein